MRGLSTTEAIFEDSSGCPGKTLLAAGAWHGSGQRELGSISLCPLKYVSYMSPEVLTPPSPLISAGSHDSMGVQAEGR